MVIVCLVDPEGHGGYDREIVSVFAGMACLVSVLIAVAVLCKLSWFVFFAGSCLVT